MSSAFRREESVDTVDSEVLPEGTTVDLTPTNFSGTFQNPCFWILVGIAGTIACQYLLKKD